MAPISNAAVPYVLITKDAVLHDATPAGQKNKLLIPGNNGRRMLATEALPKFDEYPITSPEWAAPAILPTGPGGIEIGTFTEFSRQDRHRHAKATEIYTVLRGVCRVRLNDEAPLTLQEGDELVVLPGTVHQIIETMAAPRRDGDLALLVRVHAINCHGDADKFVQMEEGGAWMVWRDLTAEQRRLACQPV